MIKKEKKSKETVQVSNTDELVRVKAQMLRALADYDNLQKRVEKDRSRIEQMALVRVVEKLIPAVDMFLKANEHVKDDGLSMAVNSLLNVLKNEGIVMIQPKEGDGFDENQHEAVEAILDDEKDGLIKEMTMSGWKLNDDYIIRPAKVRVYRKEN